MWFTGPDFLKDPDFLSNHLQSESFDNELFSDDVNESYLREMRSTEHETNCATSASSSFLTTENISFIDTLFELSNNYFKILRVFSFIRRFIYNCRNTVKKEGSFNLYRD